MSIIKSLQITNDGENVGKNEPLYIVGGNANLCSHYGKQYGVFLKKTENKTTIWANNSTIVCIYPDKMKALIWEVIWTSMFIVALFTTAKDK